MARTTHRLTMYLLLLGTLAALGAFFLSSGSARASVAENPASQLTSVSDWMAMNNLYAFLAMIRHVESSDKYNVIAGGDTFSDYREHPFILNPGRNKPIGTTASGAYQMVVGTWRMARDALGLTDFSPGSQDKAAIWILQNKRKGSYDAVIQGDIRRAMELLRNEWEAFDKMLSGQYPITIANAESFFIGNGGNLA